MNTKEFFEMIRKGMKDLVEKPAVIIPGLVFFLFVYGFSKLGGRVGYLLQTTLSNFAWTVFFWLILLLVGGFITAGWIGMCFQIIKNKKTKNVFLKTAFRYWFKNFLVLFIMGLLAGFIFLINLYLRSIISSPNVFRIVSTLVLVAWVIGFVIFFTYTNWFIVMQNVNFIEGVKRSFRLVKKEYLATLSLSFLLFYLLPKLVALIPGTTGALIQYGIILPYTFLILTRFVVGSGK